MLESDAASVSGHSTMARCTDSLEGTLNIPETSLFRSDHSATINNGIGYSRGHLNHRYLFLGLSEE
jgi:hypothetical protein